MARARYVGTRMFHRVTKTWNPIIVYPCYHRCVYCWVPHIVNRFRIRLYLESNGRPILVEKRLRERFEPGGFVFVCDTCDMFADIVPDEHILKVLEVIRRFPRTDFLLLTKNPYRLTLLLDRYGVEIFSENMIFGVTIETLDDALYNAYRISRAPSPSLRLQWLGIFIDKMIEMSGRRPRTFISVEPILLYWTTTNIEVFADILAKSIKPIMVYVGYDNYGITRKLRIPEPSLETTRKLIEALRKRGITVYEKTLRRAWWEEN